MFYLNKDVRLFAREHRRMCESFGNSCYKCELNVKYCLLTSFTYVNDDRIILMEKSDVRKP